MKYKVTVLTEKPYDYGWCKTEDGAINLKRDAQKEFKGKDIQVSIWDERLQKWVIVKKQWTLEKDIHNDGGHWLWRTEEERNDRIDELKYLQRVFRQLERYL